MWIVSAVLGLVVLGKLDAAVDPVAAVGPQDHIGRGVVGVGVHGVRAVAIKRGREAYVPDLQSGDPRHGAISPRSSRRRP